MEGVTIEGETDEEREERLRDLSRRKAVCLGRETLRWILDDRYEVNFENELPDEYDIVSVSTDPIQDGVYMIIRSDEFDPVPDGMELPKLHVDAVIERTVVDQ